jgi:threonine/homoserine/homoserine lactone efflux protein
MDIARLSLFITASVALLLTPGPAVLYIVARSVEQGRRAGLVSVLGIEAGGLFHVIAAAAGLSAILMSSALAFDIVKYLGAAYLIYMGIRALRAKDIPTDVVIERKSHRQLFTQGVIVNILNPKLALFFFAFLPQFVDPAQGSASLQFLLLGLIFIAIATVTDSGYALAAGTAGGWLQRNPHFQRFQRYVAGTVYIGLGITAAFASSGRK